LARSRRLVPARHAGRELPPPEGLLAALAAVTPVLHEVHRGRADRAGHRTDGELTNDAETACVAHEKSLLVTFVFARSISSRQVPIAAQRIGEPIQGIPGEPVHTRRTPSFSTVSTTRSEVVNDMAGAPVSSAPVA
jgi:hypothetical protein